MTDITLSTDTLVARRIRADVQAMHAYVVQDASGMVKLDAMENPFTLPPALQAALGERLGRAALNRYPDGRVNDLRAALARHADLPDGFGLVLGNGSDELISLLALACAVPPAPGSTQRPVVLAPVPHNQTVAGVPARIVGEAGCAEPARDMNQILAEKGGDI